MSDLVFAQNGQALTTSKVIASGTENTHHAVMQLLRTYKADFETFGVLAFEMPKPKNTQGGRPETIALLNEQQATLLVTYCKNTEVVRKFKIALVKAFYEMRQLLQNEAKPTTITPTQQWQIQQAVAKRAKGASVHFHTIYRAIKLRFQIAKYDQLPQRQFEDCLKFIETIDLHVPEVVSQQRLPAPRDANILLLSPDDLEKMRTFIYAYKYLFRKEIVMFSDFLMTVQSPHASMFFDSVTDWSLSNVEHILEKAGYSVKELACYKHWASHQ